MKIKPVDGIYVKIAAGEFKICPACDERFWSGDGHECYKSIFDTGWWRRIVELLNEAEKAKGTKEKKRLRYMAKFILDMRLPNPD